MTGFESSFAAFRGPVDRAVFAPGFGLWMRVAGALRHGWRRLVSLPDRGPAAQPLPPEFFRFPHF